jgi:hypothetical protein
MLFFKMAAAVIALSLTTGDHRVGQISGVRLALNWAMCSSFA